MDETGNGLYISRMPSPSPATRKRRPPQLVAYAEVRHFAPDEGMHFEPISVRGRMHDWSIPAHRHSGLLQVHWLAAGAVQASFDGDGRQLSAPALWVVPPGVVHGYRYSSGSDGCQLTVPAAVLADTSPLGAALAGRLRRPVCLEPGRRDPRRRAWGDLFTRIGAEFRATLPWRGDALRALVDVLALDILRAMPDGAPGDALTTDLVGRFRALVDANYRAHHDLAFYADALAVTPDHLSRRCRASGGMSALAILHERLGVEARRQLAYTGKPVGAIAIELGFGDPAYFSRFFARLTGAAPLAFRSRAASATRGSDHSRDQALSAF